MPQTYKLSPARKAMRPARWRSQGLAAVLWLTGCGQQNGIVGREPAPDGGGPDAGRVPTYRTDFVDSGAWQSQTRVPKASTAFGVPISGAGDANTAELRFPGHPEYPATSDIGATYRTELESPQEFGFGSYRTRLSFGSCRPSEDTVNATLGYFSDGSDANQNGLTDEEEIDFQLLCGTPNRLFLTVFTDYQADASSGAEQFRKLSRAIDFSTGEVFDTPAPDQEGFIKTDTRTAWVRPELFAEGAFYTAGFEWHASSLRFFLELDGVEQTLWTLSDPARIPQHPVTFLYNLWHPDTHWYPASGVAAFPADDVVMHVDWFEYYAE